MVQKRVIPVLLLQKGGFVKTKQFRDPVYLGDPINIVKIFNEKEVDEIIIVDINATREKKEPDFEHIGEIVSEAFMPLCFGGGITRLDQVERLFKLGVEKVAVNTSAFKNPDMIRSAVSIAGAQSIVGAMDVKKNIWGKYGVYVACGAESTKYDPISYARYLEDLGVGEIFINNISLDGGMQGYDLQMIKAIGSAVKVPIIACGGAGELTHIIDLLKVEQVSAAAAGSYFVFQGRHKAVLITYPGYDTIQEKLKSA
ncbi:AglZ/HisF2 family acetamidino modification protein [Chitinophaga lutea]